MHLDPSKLDELADLADGDLEFVADLLETYLSDALPRVESLDTALVNDDLESVGALAHALKSGSANVGAVIASNHFAALEEAVRSDAMDTIDDTLRTWKGDFETTVTEIKAWLAANPIEEL